MAEFGVAGAEHGKIPFPTRTFQQGWNVLTAVAVTHDEHQTLPDLSISMKPTWISRTVRLLAIVSSAIFLPGNRLSAAESRTTQMAPFTVEAEFGIDGLRIQNSQSVLNQHLLSQHDVAQLQDISGIAPNLFTSNSDSRGFGDILALRGSANSIFFGAPSLALYVDGVPGGSVSSYPSSLLNIDTLVVKAGPHGTDYGRNAVAGVIDIKTRTPGAEHHGKIQGEYGSYQAILVQGAFDGPIGTNAGYSASFGYNEREGYIDNTFLRRSADDRRSFAGRGALHLRPDETLQLRFGVLLEKAEDDATRLTSLFSPDRFTVSSDLNGVTEIDRHQLSFQARKQFGWGSFTSTTAWQEWKLDPALTDLDLSPFALGSSDVRQEEETWSQEFRLESLPGADKAQWRAGLFLFDSEIAGDATREFPVPPNVAGVPGFRVTERTRFDLGQRSLAIYGNVDQPVDNAGTLKFGVRVERAKSEIDRTKVGNNNFNFPTPQDNPVRASQDRAYLSATAGYVHTLSDSLSLTARASLANKPEGYSGFTGNPALVHFDDERQWANEVGFTFSPAKSRFGGSILGFWNQIRGYQFERTVPNSTDFVVVNANKVISRGVEAKFMWSPVERLWWDFQAGYSDTTFEEHRDANGANVEGRQVPFIPKYTLRTGVTVDFGGGFSGGVSYAAVGRTFFDERNTTMFSQKSYGIVNAQLRYRFDRWVTTLYVQNVCDKEYYQFINPEIFAGSPGAPRRFGVQVAFEY